VVAAGLNVGHGALPGIAQRSSWRNTQSSHVAALDSLAVVGGAVRAKLPTIGPPNARRPPSRKREARIFREVSAWETAAVVEHDDGL
jgi:hypothetical protein